MTSGLEEALRNTRQELPARRALEGLGRAEKAVPLERWSFELRIRPHASGSFHVHLLSSPAGDEVGQLHLSSLPNEIDRTVEALSQSVAGARRHLLPEPALWLSQPGLPEIGSALFQALFPEPIRRRWDECALAVGDQPGRGLRLLLKSDPTCRDTVEIHRLPWELLRDPRTGAFLALSHRTPIVRQLALDDGAVLEEPEPARRLRLLAVVSLGPSDEPLDLDREWRTIEAALSDRPSIELTRLVNPTFGELTETLRDGRFHVLHYMGHGFHDPHSGEGSLVLTSGEGMTTLLSAERLAQVARDVDSLRLVVLNACDTGRSPQSGHAAFTSLAHALIRGGVPAVLAMQVPIPDAAAIDLSRTFYRHLAAGRAVDEALAEARIAIYATDSGGASGAWAVPVLYVRRPALVIFRPSHEGVDGAGRRLLPAVALLLLAAALGILFLVPAPWSGVTLEVAASRVAFTLTAPQSLVDDLPLAELAVPDLAVLRHPDPTTGSHGFVTVRDGGSDRLGFLATPAADGGLSLDDAPLPAGTRVEIEWVAPDALRLSLELPGEDPPRGSALAAAPEVTASAGAGTTLRLVPGGSETIDLRPGGRLVMTPRASTDHGRRIDLDLLVAGAGAAVFHAPLVIDDLQFQEVEERTTGGAESQTWIEEVSTLRSGTVTLEPLGDGEPVEVAIEALQAISFEGLSGQVTTLGLGEENLVVGFRGRADRVTSREPDGSRQELVPTWSQTAWARWLGIVASILATLLVLLGQPKAFPLAFRKERT